MKPPSTFQRRVTAWAPVESDRPHWHGIVMRALGTFIAGFEIVHLSSGCCVTSSSASDGYLAPASLFCAVRSPRDRRRYPSEAIHPGGRPSSASSGTLGGGHQKNQTFRSTVPATWWTSAASRVVIWAASSHAAYPDWRWAGQHQHIKRYSLSASARENIRSPSARREGDGTEITTRHRAPFVVIVSAARSQGHGEPLAFSHRAVRPPSTGTPDSPASWTAASCSGGGVALLFT